MQAIGFLIKEVYNYVCVCVYVCVWQCNGLHVAICWPPLGSMLSHVSGTGEEEEVRQSVSHAIDTFITCGLRVNYRTRTINITS